MKNHINLWRIISSIALTAGIICAAYAGWYVYQQCEANRKYEQLQQQMEEARRQDQLKLQKIEAAEFTGEIDGQEPELPVEIILSAKDFDERNMEESNILENRIDFTKLQEINPELYAWIQVPGTRIDYPVAQHVGEDQTYYLKHNMYGEPEFAGCIYTETYNNTDFTDKNTVLYGHNMKNGSMFQNLHLFSDEGFFDNHKDIFIYLPDRILRYEIFAAYESDDRHILTSYDFSNPEFFAEYIWLIQSSRRMNVRIREELQIGTEDKIITLSTCVGGKPESRFLVQAVLSEEFKMAQK